MIEKIKALLQISRKAGKKDLVKLYSSLLGEIELEKSRPRKQSFKDQDVYIIINKFIKNNQQTIDYLNPGVGQRGILEAENVILRMLLPEKMSHNEIVNFVAHNGDLYNRVAICKSTGQAIGMVISELKRKDLSADGILVKRAVEEIREINDI